MVICERGHEAVCLSTGSGRLGLGSEDSKDNSEWDQIKFMCLDVYC